METHGNAFLKFKQKTRTIVCVSQIVEQFSSFIKAPPNGDEEVLIVSRGARYQDQQPREVNLESGLVAYK